MNKFIDTENFSRILRRRGIDLLNKKISITNFHNTQQSIDLSLPPNCNGYGRIHHFTRRVADKWPENPLPIDPACFALGIPFHDFLKVQLFQNSICSWRCWYCFVDDKLLSGNNKYSDFKSTDELVDLYTHESDISPVIDISGGQPDLVPEWTLWFLESLEKKGLKGKVYLWSDDNLSNEYFWKYLSRNEIRFMREYPCYGRVGCFKGFDKESFAFNTLAEPKLFYSQFRLLKKLVVEGFDVYGYITLTHYDDNNLENKIKDFVDLLQEKVHPLFPLRTVPLKIFQFTPTKNRMGLKQDAACKIQQTAVNYWSGELKKRFTEEELARPIYNNKIKN